MGRLSGKTAFITGAASQPGLGSATALRFAEEGANICISDINMEGLEKVAEELRAAGAEVLTLRHDVTSESDWDEAFGELLEKFGKLDILVNNAGIALLQMIDEISHNSWRKQVTVNLDSVFYGTQRAVSAMRDGKNGGSIINLSSVAGLVGIPGTGSYAASKGAVKSFTKAVAMETARENIRVNSVHPGVIWTNMQGDAIRDNKEQYDLLNESIPMGRMGEPLDIANMNLFLASDESKYITGAEFVVDGGLIVS